jgi:hypothetical protein
MTETSARFALPFIQPGQAQKELFHNEALATIEIAVQAVVLSANLAAPPEDVEPGQCWIVASGATGGWVGRDGTIAGWTTGGWRFVVPQRGMAAWSIVDDVWLQWNGTEWIPGRISGRSLSIDGSQVVGPRRAAIADPAGGGIADDEARTAITAILETLRGHGLIAV